MKEAKEYLEVIGVEAIDHETLMVEFSDGEKKEVSLSDLIKSPPPVFIKLQAVEEFKKVKINPVGGISWDCGADLSAEYLKAV
jgi:hypothetical protein